MVFRRALACALIAGAPVLPLLESACSTTKPAPHGIAPIVIGVSLGLTGSLDSFSAPLKNATKVAEVQINALGGLFGRPIEFRVIDDTSDEKAVVVQRITTLLDQGAVAVIGPAGSEQVKVTQQLLHDRKVIQLSASATSPELTTIQPPLDRFFFRTTPSDDLQGKAVVLFAFNGPPAASDAGVPEGGAGDAGTGKLYCSKMAVVHIDNSYGNFMAQVIGKFFPKRGGTVVIDIPVPAKPADNYKKEVGFVISSGAQCQALIAYDDVGDAFMTDLIARASELPKNFPIIGTDGVFTSGFIENGRLDKTNPMSPTRVEGVYGTNPDTNPPTSEFSEFRNLYNSLFPLAPMVTPDAYTANQYDAAILTILAIAQAGKVDDPVKIRDAMFAVSKGGTIFGPANLAGALQAIQNGQDVDYKGASGNVDFDDNGDVISDYIVWRVVNGAYVSDPPVDRIRAADLLKFQ